MMRVKTFTKFVGAATVAVVLLVGTVTAQGNRGTFIDSRDGKSYRYVTIGEQTWMAENLNFATSSGSWCYGNSNNNCSTHGRLYDWNVALSACPAGWRLPNNDDLNTLFTAVGGRSTANEKLRIGGTNDLGFSARPSGSRLPNGSFDLINQVGLWWSATAGMDEAQFWGAATDEADMTVHMFPPASGLSVRCIRDGGPPSQFNPNIQYGTFTDARDGKTYRTVVMPDGKTWMAENLNFATENGSWCYNDDSDCDTYGRLYNFNVAVRVCPEGWRLPSNDEWLAMVRSVGSDAKDKLRSSIGWITEGTDEFGFSALPGGGNIVGIGHSGRGAVGYWWTSTVDRGFTVSARYLSISDDRTWANRRVGGGPIDMGSERRLSVRCVQR